MIAALIASLAALAGAIAVAIRAQSMAARSDRRAEAAIGDWKATRVALAAEERARIELSAANADLASRLDATSAESEARIERMAAVIENLHARISDRRIALRADSSPDPDDLDRELRLLQDALSGGRDGSGNSGG